MIFFVFYFKMISKKSKIVSAPQAETLQLENETRIMENKLLLMKDFIKNIAKYKTYSEKEIKTLVNKKTELSSFLKSRFFHQRK